MEKEVNHRSFPSLYKGTLILPRPANSAPSFLHRGSSLCSSASSASASASAAAEDRTAYALRIHSQAEKRRRERINAHLSTLRRMIPGANKMDKASLLGKVIEQVKDLKRKVTDITNGFTIPSETNEVLVLESKLSSSSSNNNNDADQTTTSTSNCGLVYIKASLCCDDRPDLLADLIQAFHGLRLTTLRAEITTVGGRTRNVFLLCNKDEQGNTVCLNSLKESIREALSRVACSDVVSGKRQRLMQAQYFSNISF